MSDFYKLLAHMRGFPVGAGRDLTRDNVLLNAFRPMFYVSAGERVANLDRVEVRSGRTVGFYSIVCRNPRTGLKERYAWRYGVRRGVVTLEKTYPVSVRGW